MPATAKDVTSLSRLLLVATSMLPHCQLTYRTLRKSKILHKSQIHKSMYYPNVNVIFSDACIFIFFYIRIFIKFHGYFITVSYHTKPSLHILYQDCSCRRWHKPLYLVCSDTLFSISWKHISFPTNVTHFFARVTAV